MSLWLSVFSGAEAVVAFSSPAHGQVTYVDADWTSGNTMDAATGLDPITVDNVAVANNNWSIRTPFANGGSLLQGRGDGSPGSTPELKTTIGGLSPGNYDLYVFYWSGAGDWSIGAGLAPGLLTAYDTAQPPASSLSFVSNPLFAESDRTMYAAKVGQNVAIGSGSVDIFIDDLGSTASADRTWYDGVGYRVHVPTEPATNFVAGELITFTNTTAAPNGAWSWFEDERVIVDASAAGGPRILVSSVSYAGTGAEAGDVDVHWYDVNTAQQGTFELHDKLQVDDHNSAALWIRPDGRYLASYSTHTTSSGVGTTEAQKVRFRISSNPHDPTAWEDETTYLADGFRITTYSNLHSLPSDDGGNGRLYNFHRNVGFDPHILVSSDDGDTWRAWGRLFGSGGDADRPYVKYASDGEKIHFTTTERHPETFNNSIYHGYVQDGMLFRSNGELLDGDLSGGPPVDVTALTTVIDVTSAPYLGAYSRAWTVDTAIDANGHPYAVFQARIDPGAVGGGNDPAVHQFFYARYDGLSWSIHELAAAGGDITPGNGSSGYSGLVALDPKDADTLFMSTDIDPRDGHGTDRYEIYRGRTSNGGESWNWSAITENSSVDNVRPIVPEWNDHRTALLWMRGNYQSYTNWNTEVVGLVMTENLPGDYNRDGTVDAADYVVWRANVNTAAKMPNDATPGVDASDYDVWRAHFGQTLSGSAGKPPDSSSAQVPEPTAQLMLSAATMAPWLRRCRAVVPSSQRSVQILRTCMKHRINTFVQWAIEDSNL